MNIMKRIMVFNESTQTYTSKCGWTMKREENTKTFNGDRMHSKWVLRTPSNLMYEFSVFRNDIAELHDLDLVYEDD